MSFTRVVLIAIVTLLAACGQSPTQPTRTEQPPVTTVPSNPSPSPTSSGISGNWVGAFDDSDAADCATNESASASFSQDNDRVHGTLSAVGACGLERVTFEGAIDAANLSGALTVGDFTGKATGTLSGDVLELQTTDMWDSTRHRLIPAVVMHLHRQ